MDLTFIFIFNHSKGKQTMNKQMQKIGIAMILKKNYKIESDLIDLEAHVDSKLTYSENWTNIRDKFIEPKLQEVEDVARTH